MDYYQTMRNDYVHKTMYPEDPMRIDWIPKGSAQGTLTIKPKDKCRPKFVTKIEGAAVEESARVFFEGIVDAQPNPKFEWFFDDQPIIPGQRGWEDAEIHDSRKMSTLILKYAREHHMGKYTCVAHNQLGSAESNCDLIVRKKQFPPVFWQRLYNVNGEGSRRFVGEVEVGGWPVPEVYWYKVMDDGEEVEVRTRTHTENWNGNPNKYVPDRRVEVRQLDQIRHVIIFHQVSEGDSGLYRVRAVNALGEAECEAELYFDGCGAAGGDDLYLPPGWRDFKRLTWKDEDMRKKAFVGYKEEPLTPEELAEMRKKSGGVPLNRIMEYLASLPNYEPSERFRHMDRMPFKPGVDEHDYRPMRQGGRCSYPSVFKKGKMEHRGYKSDAAGRILPLWRNLKDPRSRDSSDLRWRPVHPDLFVPDLPKRCKSPDAVPVWETDEDIKKLIEFLNSMGCQLQTLGAEIRSEKLGNNYNQMNRKESSKSNVEMHSETRKTASKQGSKVEKFSYIMPNETKETQAEQQSARSAKKMWEERLNSNVVGAQTNAADFTSQFMSEMYQKKDNLSFPELDMDRPALPPKTKIMNSPSRSIFSPTESVENHATAAANTTTTAASVKSVEFMPVKEKVKLIAAQQEELNKREESSASSSTEKKSKGVRVLPPSPVTVRKMSVDEELLRYDEVVTRSTPVTQVMEKMATKPASPVQQDVFGSSYHSNVKSIRANEQDYSTLDSGISQSVSNYVTSSESREAHYSSKTSFHHQVMSSGEEMRSSGGNISVPGWTNSQSSDNRIIQQENLAKSAADKEIDQALDQLIAETESLVSEDSMFVGSSQQKYQAYTSTSQISSSVNNAIAEQAKTMYESPAEECRRSFEEAELEAMALESETSRSFSKQSSMVETCSTQSFVMQGQYSRESASHGAATSKAAAITESESSFRSAASKPMRSNSFVRSPDSFTGKTSSVSAPSTPASQRRRLRINQSPRPVDDPEPRYREAPSAPFQPGFYRPPPLDQERGHVFKLLRRSSSRSRAAAEPGSHAEVGARTSQASSRAYDGDESEVEERK